MKRLKGPGRETYGTAEVTFIIFENARLLNVTACDLPDHNIKLLIQARKIPDMSYAVSLDRGMERPIAMVQRHKLAATDLFDKKPCCSSITMFLQSGESLISLSS